MIAWHFLPNDGRLRFGPRTKVEVGVTLKCEGPPVLCKHGFHGSRRAIDALRYAPGALVCLVEIGGEIIEDTDKLVGTERTVIAMADATTLLHTFACDVAEEALDKYGGDVDPRSRRAIEVKRKWIKGEASDDELTAAWYASMAAAGAAAVDAARNAARAAAWDATMNADTDAARATAWAVARDAARDAAMAAATDAARYAATDAARYAAWAAARDAARDAAMAAQNQALENKLFDLLGVTS